MAPTKNEEYPYRSDCYEDGTAVCLGDIVETNPPECPWGEWKRGRVIKVFGPIPSQESLEWHWEPGHGGIIVERDDGGLEGFYELDEHIRLVSRAGGEHGH